MPFEKKEKKKQKTFPVHFVLRNLDVEKEFVTCCGAEEVPSALFYIYRLCWNQTHPASAPKGGGVRV